MSDSPQCLNCSRLGSCVETSSQKVSTGYVCSNWKETSAEVYAARYQAIKLFGNAGLNAVIHKDFQEED